MTSFYFAVRVADADGRRPDPAYLAAGAFIMGFCPVGVPFGTPKGTEKGPATSDSARLAAHNERRHPAKRARSCASKPHWGFDRCATAQQPGLGAARP